MSYQVTYIREPEFLRAIVNGDKAEDYNKSVMDCSRAFTEIYETASNENVERLMICYCVDGYISRELAVDVITEIRDSNFGMFNSIALHFTDQDSFKNIHFYQKIAQKIGWNVKFFAENFEAQKWLVG